MIDVLLELHIAQEATKYGLTIDACRQLLDDGEWRNLNNVRICGLMMMASNTDDEQQIASEFDEAAQFFDEVKAKYFADSAAFCRRFSKNVHTLLRAKRLVRAGVELHRRSRRRLS